MPSSRGGLLGIGLRRRRNQQALGCSLSSVSFFRFCLSFSPDSAAIVLHCLLPLVDADEENADDGDAGRVESRPSRRRGEDRRDNGCEPASSGLPRDSFVSHYNQPVGRRPPAELSGSDWLRLAPARLKATHGRRWLLEHAPEGSAAT